MPIELIDSHCHLDRLDLNALGMDMDGVVDAAAHQGVTHLLCVCIDYSNFADVLEIAQTRANVFASVGVHPNEENCEEPTLEGLLSRADDPNIVAIGETGLDYFRCQGDMGWQQQRFRVHIEAAKSLNKPLIIHTRDAKADTLAILKEGNAAQCGGVLHCFTEDWAMASAALEMGFYISFSGIVTFKNATELKEVAKRVPLARMLVETDAPYLTPVPFRGKPNQPAHVRHVAEHIAELRQIPVEELAAATTENFFTLFDSAER